MEWGGCVWSVAQQVVTASTTLRPTREVIQSHLGRGLTIPRPSLEESWPLMCRAYLGCPNVALISPTGLGPVAGVCLRGASMAFGQFLMTAAECNPTEAKSYGRNRGERVSCRCRCSNTEHNCRWEECGVMGYGEGRDHTLAVHRPRPYPRPSRQ